MHYSAPVSGQTLHIFPTRYHHLLVNVNTLVNGSDPANPQQGLPRNWINC